MVSVLEGPKQNQIFICYIYRPPTTAPASDAQLLSLLHQIHDKYSRSFLLGNFNADQIDWYDVTLLAPETLL